MQYQMQDFTYDDVRSASSNYLRRCLTVSYTHLTLPTTG